jgi:hypothetical protein
MCGCTCTGTHIHLQPDVYSTTPAHARTTSQNKLQSTFVLNKKKKFMSACASAACAVYFRQFLKGIIYSLEKSY